MSREHLHGLMRIMRCNEHSFMSSLCRDSFRCLACRCFIGCTWCLASCSSCLPSCMTSSCGPTLFQVMTPSPDLPALHFHPAPNSICTALRPVIKAKFHVVMTGTLACIQHLPHLLNLLGFCITNPRLAQLMDCPL